MQEFKVRFDCNEVHANYVVTLEGNPAEDDFSIGIMENPFEGVSRCVSVSSDLLDKLIKLRETWNAVRGIDH